MEINTITSLIASIGFPILAYLQLFKYVQSQGEKHAEEVEALRQTIERNTEIMVALKEEIENNAD